MKSLKLSLIFVLILLSSSLSNAQKIVETGFFKNNPELGGDVVINSSTQEVLGGRSYTTFEIEAPSAGNYYLNAWLMPAKLANGNYSRYDVLVNGVRISGKIAPDSDGWQSIGLSTGKVTLKQGKNTVSVVANAPEIAQVEHIRLSPQIAKAAISSLKYDNFYQEAKANSLKTANEAPASLRAASTEGGTTGATGTITQGTQLSNPLGNYYHRMNVDYRYTYYTSYSFSAGQQIFIATNGVNSFAHDLYVFSTSSPETYSWSARSNSNSLASLNITIPVAGTYYILIAAANNFTTGLCNVNINGQYYYNNVAISRVEYRHTQDNQRVYNTFTAYKTTDTRIWITEGTSSPGKISAWNDDYGSHGGDFSWGTHSRIKKQYPRAVHGVLVSTYSSSSPTGICDLYAGCQNSTIYPYFENSKADDLIQSAPASTVYNCVSWAGGIHDEWEWPLSPYSEYYVSGNDLASFDLFFTSARYDGCVLYSRNGATSSNGVVALWGINNNGPIAYTHASIRKVSDNHPHGYDWESKPGSLMRTFHPRDALNGSGYGTIQHYYRRVGTVAYYTLAEAIAAGWVVVRTVTYGTLVRNVIAAEKANMSTAEKNTFTTKYNAWKATWAESPYSDPAKFKNSQYNDLINFCNTVAGANYLVFEKVEEDALSTLLVDELTLYSPSNHSILSGVKDDNAALRSSSSGNVDIVTFPKSTCVEYISRMLSWGGGAFSYAPQSTEETTGIEVRYSNTDEFHVTVNGKNISVDFTNAKSAKVSLSIVDLNGREIASILNNQQVASGHKQYSVNLPQSGVYLVKYVLDNNLNVKKVIVK
ncbi:MAG: T9SS type A sorting domain-containing protein [Bacteroidales bacterium]|jgi:hypothetical protein|nr:T9SS type A sorting domain-containing protein [Bacteroidales bacterium]